MCIRDSIIRGGIPLEQPLSDMDYYIGFNQELQEEYSAVLSGLRTKNIDTMLPDLLPPFLTGSPFVFFVILQLFSFSSFHVIYVCNN